VIRLDTRTSIAKNDLARRMMFALLSLVRKIIRASVMPEHIGVESMKSVKSTHSVHHQNPENNSGHYTTEKIKSISLICYVSRKLFVCLSRVGDREWTGEALTDRMFTRKAG
jgi:hypothetical protein